MKRVCALTVALAAAQPLAADARLAELQEGAVASAAMMSVARAVHTATALADGSVLVVGGCTSRGCELGGSAGMVAERYDTAGRRFTAAGRLQEWRDDHTATRLRDGRVLVAGGWGAGSVIATTELYDPRRRTFARGPAMGSRRAGATATLLRDGRVLLAGGFTDNRPTIARAEVFVPAAGSFRPVGAMRSPRGAHAAALLPDGQVLIAGGLSRGQVVATTEIFDPRRSRFASAPAMRQPRYKAAAVTLADGRVLVIGGAADVEGTRPYRTTEIYEPLRNRFVPGPAMHAARYKIAGSVVRLANGDVLVAGGARVPELLRSGSREFSLVAGTLGESRQFMTATRIGRRAALLIGGYGNDITPTAQAWLYR